MIAAILRFGEHDLICYRAEAPPELAARQAARLGPACWIGPASRHGAQVANRQPGLAHSRAAAGALARLRRRHRRHDDFALAALHVLASITGSLVLALALAEGAHRSARAFALSRMDEDLSGRTLGQG